VLLQELRMLGHNKRVLVIGAHPDDEDTQLLVMFTRREGAEAAYLSLTRGEGGQNLIGSELGEALGILRTEELLAARNVDGAQQFFTRAYDFGFSKTLDDTWAHWPSDSVLKDVVRIVRRFRPQVIVSIFSGTPRDGHGQHQAAGWAAAQAFRVAGDSTRFPELATEEGLQPWAPAKLYVDAWFNAGAATLTLDGGEVEKISGKTYHQLAMAARSLHRSQDMGSLQEFGPSPSRLAFAAVRGGTADVGEGWAGFWSGVDTVLRAPPEHFAALADARAAAGRDRRAVADALSRAARSGPDARIPGAATASDYERHLFVARQVVAWQFTDAIAERAGAVPGDSIQLELLARSGDLSLTSARIWVVMGLGQEILVGPGCQGSVRLVPGEFQRCRHAVAVPSDRVPTAPYYLRLSRSSDLYDWSSAEPWTKGMPRELQELSVSLMEGGEASLRPDALGFPTMISTRVRDQAFGEVRRPVVIVPRVSVKISPTTAVIRSGAQGSARSITLDVTAEHGATDTTRGTIQLERPSGWPRPSPVPFVLAGGGAVTHARFEVAAPASAPVGQVDVKAVAIDATGRRYDIGAFMVEYPHIRPRQYTKPAIARVEVIDLTPPPVRRIAYIRGAADRVPEALRAAGLDVTVLDSIQIATADLSDYDAVVVGSRAYEVDSALVHNNGRLLDYARNGGRLIVQYQQGVFTEGNFAPFPVTQGSPADRITDEKSPVTMLGARRAQSALAPVFRTPNAIGPDDWDGWVQDRALYCLRTWDPRYESLLSMNDPGERAIGGCLLEAPLGRGSYVYTGLAFFRELPAGVPGAYRLFFNLLGGRVTP
jgi:LmbE family N-acetylglucosaminyl deacetylase